MTVGGCDRETMGRAQIGLRAGHLALQFEPFLLPGAARISEHGLYERL